MYISSCVFLFFDCLGVLVVVGVYVVKVVF